MKNIFKGTIIFGVCLTLAACGTESPQDITVQSINEPVATQQTVGQPVVTTVADTTLGTVNASGTEGWEETVATEPGDCEPVAEAYTGVTFPETMDDWEHAYLIEDMFYTGLPVYPWLENGGSGTGLSDYDECDQCYKRLLVEKFLDYPDNFSLFGGAYWSDGRLVLRITDYSKRDDIFSDIFDGLESVDVEECTYSYSYLLEVRGAALQNEKVKTHLINVRNNRVEVGGEFTEEDTEKICADLEAAGLDPNAAEFSVREAVPVANPC